MDDMAVVQWICPNGEVVYSDPMSHANALVITYRHCPQPGIIAPSVFKSGTNEFEVALKVFYRRNLNPPCGLRRLTLRERVAAWVQDLWGPAK